MKREAAQRLQKCLFSSYLGGYSGNRGFCKQPCRRRYYSNNGNGFFFSPQDLETLELIGELRKIGVDSLKIEGRLRQPDYVYNTVKAYRMILDAPDSTPTPELLGEARVLLSKSCGRKWSKGFFSDDSMKNLIIHDNIGSAGMLIGTVSKIAEKGFAFTHSCCQHRCYDYHSLRNILERNTAGNKQQVLTLQLGFHREIVAVGATNGDLIAHFQAMQALGQFTAALDGKFLEFLVGGGRGNGEHTLAHTGDGKHSTLPGHMLEGLFALGEIDIAFHKLCISVFVNDFLGNLIRGNQNETALVHRLQKELELVDRGHPLVVTALLETTLAKGAVGIHD